eukprot:scaffold67293_cov42-Prasinocladus_malaysianus.AAC.1
MAHYRTTYHMTVLLADTCVGCTNTSLEQAVSRPAASSGKGIHKAIYESGSILLCGPIAAAFMELCVKTLSSHGVYVLSEWGNPPCIRRVGIA